MISKCTFEYLQYWDGLSSALIGDWKFTHYLNQGFSIHPIM